MIRDLRQRFTRSSAPVKQFLTDRGVNRFQNLWHINAVAIEAEPALIEAIATRADVASVSLNRTVALPPALPAAVAAPEWNLTQAGVFELWQQLQPALPGEGIVVATIDSGADATHPDLSNWRGGVGDWFDLSGATTTPVDGDGHGTAVMGVIAADADNGGNAIGVAPASLWIAANPFHAGNASFADLHSSFAWVLDPDGDAGTDDMPDVVNNSWVLDNPGNCATEFQADIDLLRAAGIAVVFAAGNEGPNPLTSQSPANNQRLLATGSTGPDGTVSWFSSRGGSACDGTIFPDVVAPGDDVRTTFPGGYVTASGTSFAAPHITGIVALLMQAFPAATVEEIETAIVASAVDLGPVGPDNDYGFGRVQAMRAWRYLAGEPILSVHDPAAPENDRFLDFGNVAPQSSVVRNLTLRNAGSTDLSLFEIDFTNLLDPLSLVSDQCSNTLLSPGGECLVAIGFAPPDSGTYTGSLLIPGDDPVAASVQVLFAGVGNSPPPAPALLFPVAGAEVDPQPVVTFSWRQVADADGDPITNALLVSTIPDFSQSTPILVTAASPFDHQFLIAGCGLLALVFWWQRRKIGSGYLLPILIAFLFLISCGGGSGGSGGSAPGEQVSFDLAGLNPATTYFWKIRATDSRGAATDSVMRSFSTP